MEIRTLGDLAIRDASQVAEARRFAGSLARNIGLDEADVAKLSIVVTEAATNLIKHAGEGEFVFSSLHSGGRVGFAMLSLDRGPGIPNLTASLVDGYSTSGSLGSGLGAITRLASAFDIYSSPSGTGLLAVVWSGGPPQFPSSPLEIGAISLPKPGEEVNGDAWATRHSGPSVQILVVDGLGHGMDAYEAARETVRIFSAASGQPDAIIEEIHRDLFHTRGAAVSVAEIDTSARTIGYTGLGNISGVVIAPERVYNLVSQNGTAGLEARKIQQFNYPWPEHSLLVLHTDGLSHRLPVLDDAVLRQRNPLLIAGILYRDCRRERDDASVIVARDFRRGGSL